MSYYFAERGQNEEKLKILTEADIHAMMKVEEEELCKLQPIDQMAPVKLLNGNTNLYFMMLGRLEQMSLRPNIDAIATALDVEDWTTV